MFLADETIRKFSSVKIQRTKTNLSVIYEDQDVVLINKPVGMLSQKAKESDVSLVEHLISYLLDAGELSEETLKSFRPSICNRLDRNTSGIVVAGKKPFRGFRKWENFSKSELSTNIIDVLCRE